MKKWLAPMLAYKKLVFIEIEVWFLTLIGIEKYVPAKTKNIILKSVNYICDVVKKEVGVE
jgi:hypothetical protein